MGIKRRILLVALGTLLLCAAVLAALALQHRNLERQLRQQRDDAVVAVTQGRSAEARGALESYLHRAQAPDDLDAMVALAQAIVSTPTAGRGDRVQAMRLLAHVAERVPANAPVRERLLELQAELGFDEELVRTADDLLAITRDDAVAQRARRLKAEALLRLEHYDAALATAYDAIAAAPRDVALHGLALTVLDQGPWPPRTLIDHAQSDRWFGDDADDVRRVALLATAHRLTGAASRAHRALNACLDAPLPDAATARLLVDQLEALDRFDAALALLERGAAAFDDPALDLALAHRLWQRGRGADLLDHLTARGLSPDDELTDLVALRAKALLRQDHDTRARPWIDALRVRSAADAGAHAWSIYLTGVFDQRTSPEAVIRRCRQALARDAANPYIHRALAEALASRGERVTALVHWRAAADAAPAWAEPRLRAARALTELGLGEQALATARAAQHRAGGDDLEARIVFVEARRLEALSADRGDVAELLAQVSEIQRDHPHEPRTLPLYVHLLAELNRREDAGEALLAALDRALPEATLLRLARVSRAHGLGLAEACYAQSEALHGPTSALALARAGDRWRRGYRERAAAPFDRAPVRGAAGEADGESDVSWDLAYARHLDQTRQDTAADVWRVLLREHPDSLAVHLAAIDANAVRGDRSLMRDTIAALGELTDEGSVTWRLALGRWLLESDLLTAARAVEAALLLGEVRREAPWLIEGRLWLARALVELGEPDAAIAQLRAAADYEPNHQPALLELARLLMERGDEDEALARLNRVVNHRGSTVSQLQDAAGMLVALRGWDEAVAALTRAAEAGGRTPGELLLVGLGEEVVPEASDSAEDAAVAR